MMSSRDGRDAESRCAPTAGNAVRTNGSTRQVRPDPGIARQWPALPSLADDPRPPPLRPTQDHPEAAGNPDASHSFAGPASARFASRGSRDHESSPGSAGQRRAAPRVGPPVHSHRHSKSARGRSSCRSAPASGSARTGTAGRVCLRLKPPPWMDGGRNGWNTAPACVLGTVWGTASNPRLGRLGRRRACPSNRFVTAPLCAPRPLPPCDRVRSTKRPVDMWTTQGRCPHPHRPQQKQLSPV